MSRRFRIAALAALALLAFTAQALAQSGAVTCRSSAVYDASTNGSTILVTGRANASVFICGYQIWGGGTATVSFVYGTGTTCATGETKITPAYSVTAQNGPGDSSSVYRGLFAPAGKDVCIKTSAGVAIQGLLLYVQQ